MRFFFAPPSSAAWRAAPQTADRRFSRTESAVPFRKPSLGRRVEQPGRPPGSEDRGPADAVRQTREPAGQERVPRVASHGRVRHRGKVLNVLRDGERAGLENEGTAAPTTMTSNGRP